MIYCLALTWGFFEKSTLVWKLREFSSVCENHVMVQIFLFYSWEILLQIFVLPITNMLVFPNSWSHKKPIVSTLPKDSDTWTSTSVLDLSTSGEPNDLLQKTTSVLVKTILFSFLCLGLWLITFSHCEVKILNTHKELYELVFSFIDWRESISSIKLPYEEDTVMIQALVRDVWTLPSAQWRWGDGDTPVFSCLISKDQNSWDRGSEHGSVNKYHSAMK